MHKIHTLIFASLTLVLCSCNTTQKNLKNTVEIPQNTSLAPYMAEAEKIHDDIFSVDSHTDTPLNFTYKNFDVTKDNSKTYVRSCVDFPRMRTGRLDGVFLAAFVGQGNRNEAGNMRAYNRVNQIIDSIHAIVQRNPSICGLALKPSDAYRLKEQHKISVFIGIENGYAIGNDLKKVEYFYDKGARYITLCHTKNNDICTSSTDNTEGKGVSEFGRQVVAEMNRLGMMVDVSHISDESFYDVLTLTQAPVIASHSCARALCNNPRNLSDDMLKALAKNGGVVQMCILSDYVKPSVPNPEKDKAFNAFREKYRNYDSMTEKERANVHEAYNKLEEKYAGQKATVADAVNHIDHIVKLIGIEHVGIGTDFDGGGGLADCKDASELKNITAELLKRGYTKEQLKLLWGGNLMRVMDEVAKKASKS